MSNACTPILVDVTSPVSEILLLSKTAKFPFLTMDYSPWSSKNLIDWNWLKKFMQVGVDVKCMHTNFGGCDLSSFGDIATLKFGQISLSDHGPSPWSVHGSEKIELTRIGSKNFMQVEVDVNACAPILVGVVSPVSEILHAFKNSQIFLL